MMLRRALVALAGLALGACQTLPDTPAAVAVWASSADASRKLERQPDVAILPAAVPVPDELVIDASQTDQAIVGYGAAMSDASALLLRDKLSPAAREALLRDLFGAEGLALNFMRLPIGASDFSVRHYSLNDIPAGETDPQLTRFSMAEPQAAQIPMTQAARRVNPGLVLMASPWSAPAWMKDSASLIKGQLKPEHYDAYARYFARYLDAMDAAGLPVRYVSVQNEPDFEPANYPGMRVTPAARAAFIGQHLGPLLAQRKRPVSVLDWDHNWDQPQQPLTVLADPAANAHVAGVAWHCYAGDPAAMETVRRAHPDKDVFFTECSGGQWAPNWGETLGWMIDNLIIAPSRAGSRGTLLWNLALDENYGPHLGGCGDCRGVVTIDSRTGAVTRNVEYYVLGHVSRFVRPGARRVASSGGGADLRHAAFRNPDGSLALVLRNGGKSVAALAIRSGGRAWRLMVPAGEVMTLTWRAAGSAR
ncbi:glycoside hydrolase family 30 beta sandwich domain-containing protein [Novosphingobium sp.]|uniref:glycoside hydrolase family 30 protein n=1 Tax=Novosphingobium sp. TaxID=1874826 RepID=UPI002733FD04|nr:glycoside hydrolase family 30 beta sandwich domain-containing protein [Novosphingobium sp.]MDP3907333.1 glycoside hydrolase family 30 beta sandwich domain-containing protein [Novosphingobium sp.]